VDADAERVERVVRAAPRSKPIRYAEEVLLVDRVQQRGDRERALPSVRLGYVVDREERRFAMTAVGVFLA